MPRNQGLTQAPIPSADRFADIRNIRSTSTAIRTLRLASLARHPRGSAMLARPYDIRGKAAKAFSNARHGCGLTLGCEKRLTAGWPLDGAAT